MNLDCTNIHEIFKNHVRSYVELLLDAARRPEWKDAVYCLARFFYTQKLCCFLIPAFRVHLEDVNVETLGFYEIIEIFSRTSWPILNMISTCQVD